MNMSLMVPALGAGLGYVTSAPAKKAKFAVIGAIAGAVGYMMLSGGIRASYTQQKYLNPVAGSRQRQLQNSLIRARGPNYAFGAREGISSNPQFDAFGQPNRVHYY